MYGYHGLGDWTGAKVRIAYPKTVMQNRFWLFSQHIDHYSIQLKWYLLRPYTSSTSIWFSEVLSCSSDKNWFRNNTWSTSAKSSPFSSRSLRLFLPDFILLTLSDEKLRAEQSVILFATSSTCSPEERISALFIFRHSSIFQRHLSQPLAKESRKTYAISYLLLSH